MSEAPRRWTVYMIRCDDGSLYTGVTTDLERRFGEHGNGKRGARFFAGRRPEAIVWSESGHDRSSALRREAAIKKLDRRQKLRLAASATASRAQGGAKSSP